jgi:hypothetical protein
MIRVVKMKPHHLQELRLQPMQEGLSATITDDAYAQSLAETDYAFAVLAGGKVIACAGCLEMWENRAYAWSMISKDAGPHFFGFLRVVDGFLKQAPWRRIEAAVQSDFAQAHRMIRLLGFEFEGRMRAFSVDGVDNDLYARVRHG